MSPYRTMILLERGARMAEMYEGDRHIDARYRDPLDVIWLATAKRLGLRIRRSGEVYASTDGEGLLTLSDAGGFDPDDTLAQMVLHEVCHWVINGEDSYHRPDWGFELDWEVDWREYATQRLQAAWADRYGLRAFFGSTGTYRVYYDRLGVDPLAPLAESEEESHICVQARAAFVQAQQPPWGPALDAALRATAQLQGVLRPFMPDYASDEEGDALPCLWGTSAATPGVTDVASANGTPTHEGSE
jgi:hypothetical protein